MTSIDIKTENQSERVILNETELYNVNYKDI